MSNKRITDLTELTTPTTDDVLPIVDIATNTTQKVQVGNLPTTTAVTNALATKQDTLVSGTNIKTVNSTSLVGSGNIAVQETLVSGTNIKTLNSTSLLGSGNIVLTANPSGVAGAIQFSNGSAFASDATNLFWDDTNNRLGVGTNTPNNTTEIQIPSTYGAIGSNANLYLTSALTSAGIKIGASGSGGGCTIQATQSGGGTAFNLALNPFGGSVNVGNSNLGASLGIKGSGSTSATTSLLVQNSAGTAALTVLDNLTTSFGGATTTSGDLNFTGNIIRTSRGRINFYGTDGEITLTNSTENGFGLLKFGGLTSSFPALKRNGTAIDVRLADDSNYAGFNTGATFIKGSGTTSATTSLLVQNSGGTAAVTVKDDLSATFGGLVQGTSLVATANINFGNILYGNNFWNQSDGGTKLGAASAPVASAILEMVSTTKGFLPPRMTTTQKNNISSPASGLVVYDTTTNKLCCYNGSSWNDLF